LLAIYIPTKAQTVAWVENLMTRIEVDLHAPQSLMFHHVKPKEGGMCATQPTTSARMPPFHLKITFSLAAAFECCHVMHRGVFKPGSLPIQDIS
jgi:hypothetical protein